MTLLPFALDARVRVAAFEALRAYAKKASLGTRTVRRGGAKRRTVAPKHP